MAKCQRLTGISLQEVGIGSGKVPIMGDMSHGKDNFEMDGRLAMPARRKRFAAQHYHVVVIAMPIMENAVHAGNRRDLAWSEGAVIASGVLHCVV